MHMAHSRFQKALIVLMTTTFAYVQGCSGGGSSSSSAQDVETPGSGRYNRIRANVGVIFIDGSIQARIPSRVSVGQTIDISFVKDGQEITDSWKVVRISTKDTLCRLHNAPERTVGDTVYVKPCKVVR
jgi:hypothetical protein